MQKPLGSVGFYERLRDEIERRIGKEEGKEWTQAKFADHVRNLTGYGLTQTRVSDLKRIKTSAYNLEEIEAICIGFGISPEWMVFSRGEKMLLTSHTTRKPTKGEKLSPSRSGDRKSGTR